MSILNEIFRIVGRLLPESVCRLCGYDNPYMDDVPDYVCRQCTMRAEKWGDGVKKAPIATPIADEDDCEDDNEECDWCCADITGNGGHCDTCDDGDVDKLNALRIDPI